MTSAAATPGPRSAGRPRDPHARRRLLDAALEEYAERGWSGFTMDGVARRAGVGKSTLYRRWADKESLLNDTLTVWSNQVDQVDTGTLRGDLELMASNLLRYYLDPAGWVTLRLVVDAAVLTTAPARFAEEVVDRNLKAAAVLIDRAVDRNEIAPGTPTRQLTEFFYGGVTISALGIPADQRTMTDTEIEARTRPLVDFLMTSVTVL
jgi:AcrR family transcriptional regulator